MTDSGFDDDTDDREDAGTDLSNPEFASGVNDAVFDMRVRQEAKRRITREAWSGFEEQGTLAHQIDNPEPEIGWTVEGLIPAYGVVQINAQWKVGKSTLGSVNLARCLATGDPFLRRFPVHLEPSENVAIWNHEVDKQTLVDWLAATKLDRNAQERIFPLALRGRTIDFLIEAVADDTVKWLRERSIAVWVIDPLSKLYLGDENSNSEYNAWWAAMQGIAVKAGVRVVVIIHHTGHTGNRARGASAMMGNPDVLITYRHGGDAGELPPDNRRWLRAFGRNVDMPEIQLAFNPSSHELYAEENGKARVDVQTEQWAQRAYRAIEKAGRPLNAKELAAACSWPGRGGGYTARMRAVNDAAEWGWFVVEAGGPGKPTLHSLGPVEPERMKPLRLATVNGETTTGGGNGA